LPHSDTPGSPIARISPGLFAACHVLHRLSVPRHPPDALPSRLSATPNGKNHRRNRRFRRGRQAKRQLRRKPRSNPRCRQAHATGWHSSLLGGACKASPLEDTIGTPHAQTSRANNPSGRRRMDPASVTQLAIHICPSTTRPRRSRTGRGEELLHATYQVGDAPAGLSALLRNACRLAATMLRPGFRRNCVSPVALGRTAFGRWWR
jgi:hypothetical protein